MKEATGEVSGVVVTIVIIAAVLGIGTLLFQKGGFAQTWIENIFKTQLGEPNNQR